MPMVTINGQEVEVDKGISILEAAALAGFDVPHFCYHPALSAPANCRMCLVEVEGARKLVPACYNSVNDGMIVETDSERVERARKAVLEFILVNHPVDCPICDKAGECKLQDYYFAYDAQESRMRAEKQHKVKAYPIGPRVVYDGERCILCTRCIRFCEEIVPRAFENPDDYAPELTLIDRGDKIEVRTFPGSDLDNDYSLCTVDVCPVGALTSRDFRFKCRVWLLTSTESVCTGCSMGCNVHLDHFRNEVQRYRPRYNPEVNEYWMCDEGRLTYQRIHADRLLRPLSNGAEMNWHHMGQHVAKKLKSVLSTYGPEGIALVLSPQASCEDLYLAKLFSESLGQGVRLYINGLPRGREDAFLIQADKNPNRRGIEAVFGGLDDIGDLRTLARDIQSEGGPRAVYMMGTDISFSAENRGSFVSLLNTLDLFILHAQHRVQDLLDVAHVVLPICSHAEKEGTFVNEEGIAQPFFKAFDPHGESLPDWQIFARLARAMGESLRFTFLHQIQDAMFEATVHTTAAQEATGATGAERSVEPAASGLPADIETPSSDTDDKDEAQPPAE